jgi:thioredoxin-related protein
MRNRIVMLFVSALALAGVARADPPQGYPFVRYDDGLRRAAAENRRIFLYFGRYGCGFCEKTNRESFSDARVRDAYLKNYVLVYVDAESGQRLTLPSGERLTELELGARMKVKITPVFAFLEPDGATILRVPGFQTAADFLAYHRYVEGGHYKTRSLNDFLAQGQ